MDNISLIQQLQWDNAELRELIGELKEKINFFEDHPKIAAGIKGESLIVSCIDAALAGKNSSYDIHIEHNGLLLEVKFSRITIADKRNSSPTKRWTGGKSLVNREIRSMTD
ncbi:MAG TPA: hypothetical protein VNA16_09700 [Abditibacteriaceae bacterium]|nr:hypothetical protein [Abditibacteriaceae bacterium]